MRKLLLGTAAALGFAALAPAANALPIFIGYSTNGGATITDFAGSGSDASASITGAAVGGFTINLELAHGITNAFHTCSPTNSSGKQYARRQFRAQAGSIISLTRARPNRFQALLRHFTQRVHSITRSRPRA